MKGDFAGRQQGAAEKISDEQLALQAQGGSALAFQQLADRYRPLLLHHVGRQLRHNHDAEDVVQETLIRVSRYLHRYDASRPFLPWLLTIATRLAISHRRKGSTRQANVSLDRGIEKADMRAAPPDELSQAEFTLRLWQTIEDYLPARQYQVLHLRYAQGLSISEVARHCDLTRLHVKVLLHRARRRLLKCGSIKRMISPA